MSTAPPEAPRHPYLVLAVVAGGTLLNTLAASTITLALPAIGQGLALSIDRSRWVMQAYLLVTTVALLPAGRLGDLLGHRRVYLSGFLLFGLASLGAGLAPSFPLLTAARLAQGAGAAMVMSAGPALITTSLPPAVRGRSLGLLSTATYLGLTAGPPLGGWLIAALSWRAVFFINLPIALLVVTLGGLTLPRTGGASARFDAAGAVTLGLGSLLLLGLGEGPTWGWSSPPTLACLGLGLAALVAFVRLERRSPAPLLDLGLFRVRAFTGSTLAALCNYVALFVPIILLPFLLIEGMGSTPRAAGLLLTAQPILMALTASPSGWLSDRIGSRALAASGLTILAAAVFLLGETDAATSRDRLTLLLALAGLGTGLFVSPNSSALMGAAPRTQQGVAGAVMATARNLGMLIGTGAGTEIFHQAGGRSGARWRPLDYRAFRFAQRVASGSSVLGALFALLAAPPSGPRHG
jgi:EmrB/QacA subfamily drug resistance transporter